MKRATDEHIDPKIFDSISIHALVKRATFPEYELTQKMIISIHALVKRATAQREFITKSEANFNPRPREEGDITINGNFPCFKYFNPRPREEGDAPVTVRVSLTVYFNPRPREEGDYESVFPVLNIRIFQSTPS